MTAAFGTPAPLPGQPGFRARPSDAMAREAAEMEERLSRLKTDLTTEAEMREAAGPRVGGSRWRSARADRGSVRAYAKDIKVRHHQQQLQQQQCPPHGHGSFSATGGVGLGRQTKTQAGAGARVATARRDEQQQQQQQQQQQRYRRQVQAEHRREDSAVCSPSSSASCGRLSALSGFAEKEVSKWSVVDTLEWLDGLGLGAHCGVFQQNEISGPILLEVGPDDLDYMKVRVLAHRKRILKGIEELRGGGGGRSNVDVPPPPAPVDDVGRSKPRTIGERRVEAVKNEEVCRQGDNRLLSRKIKRQHWSRVKPLSDNQTDETDGGSCGGSASNRLGDGTYDEAAAHSSFADAVAEWRGQKGQKKTTAPPTSSSPRAAGRSPVVEIQPAPEPYITARDPGRRGHTKVGELLGGSSASACWTNPFATPPSTGHGGAGTGAESEAALEVQLASPPGRANKARVPCVGEERPARAREEGSPTLDEEAEHAAFRKAVEEWNRESGKHAKKEDNDDSGARDASLLPATPRLKAEEMAEALRDQMDAEHRMQARELEERKKALLRGLDTAKRQHDNCRVSRERGERKQGFDAAAAESKHADRMPVTAESSGDFAGDDGPEWRKTAWESAARREEERGEPEPEPWEEGHNGELPSASSSCSRVISSSSSRGEESPAEDVGFVAREEGGSSLEIELMESVLGTDFSVEDSTCYLVDEGESSGTDDL